VPPGLTVPLDALIDSGREQRVFVERSKGMFEPRQVETGRRLSDRVEIVRGLAEGERVVAAGTFLVDSESRLRSNVQAPPKQQQHDKVTPQPGSRPGLAVHASQERCGVRHDDRPGEGRRCRQHAPSRWRYLLLLL